MLTKKKLGRKNTVRRYRMDRNKNTKTRTYRGEESHKMTAMSIIESKHIGRCIYNKINEH